MSTSPFRPGHRLRRWLLATLVALVGAVTVFGAHASAGPEPSRHDGVTKPTVVLVHGAWADSSGWNGVIQRLQRDGYPVIAVANPLRSLDGDAAYVRSMLEQTPGPIVLVGHSYGGAVITNAAAGNPNVKALVYVAGFIPDIGEDVLHLSGEGSQVPVSIEFRGFPPFGETDVDIYIKPDMFRSTFAGDLPARETAVMAATQRPLAFPAGASPTTQTAWREIPCWAIIPRQDRTITPDQQRFMAERAGAQVTEVRSSHVVMISKPGVVADIIETAARATS